MNSHDPSIEEIIRRAREAGAADLNRQRPAFTRQSPAVSDDTEQDTAQDTAWPPSDPGAWEHEVRWQREVRAYQRELARQMGLEWARNTPAPAPERIPLWVWCAGVAVVQFLVGCFLLLTAMYPSALSYVLALAGFCTTVSLCVPEGRAQPLVCLLTPYPAVFVIGLVVGFFTSFP